MELSLYIQNKDKEYRNLLEKSKTQISEIEQKIARATKKINSLLQEYDSGKGRINSDKEDSLVTESQNYEENIKNAENTAMQKYRNLDDEENERKNNVEKEYERKVAAAKQAYDNNIAEINRKCNDKKQKAGVPFVKRKKEIEQSKKDTMRKKDDEQAGEIFRLEVLLKDKQATAYCSKRIVESKIEAYNQALNGEINAAKRRNFGLGTENEKSKLEAAIKEYYEALWKVEQTKRLLNNKRNSPVFAVDVSELEKQIQENENNRKAVMAGIEAEYLEKIKNETENDLDY